MSPVDTGDAIRGIFGSHEWSGTSEQEQADRVGVRFDDSVV